MGAHSNKYIIITVGIIGITITVDITHIEFIDMVIGIIIEKKGAWLIMRPPPHLSKAQCACLPNNPRQPFLLRFIVAVIAASVAGSFVFLRPPDTGSSSAP
jgi:hypothetical protein